MIAANEVQATGIGMNMRQDRTGPAMACEYKERGQCGILEPERRNCWQMMALHLMIPTFPESPMHPRC